MSALRVPKILKRLSRRIPDALYLQLRYFHRFHHFCNLRNPQTFSEKLQWLKLNDRRPLYTRLVDKYEAKVWVSERLGSSHVIPLLGVWDTFEQIDFRELPEQFVLKCTHDSGGLAICRDRSKFDIEDARARINRSLTRNYYYSGREWPYKDVRPRIIAERYFPTWNPKSSNDVLKEADDIEQLGVLDYKFYCFDGEPKFLYVSRGLHDHSTAQVAFLTLEWKPANFRRQDYTPFDQLPPRPANLPEMIEIARKLSGGIPFVRVDLFEHADTVLFSEMTLHPVSGMMPVSPQSADLEIGNLLTLPVYGRSAGSSVADRP